MLKTSGHRWQFKARFRRRAFGWKSQPAITRVREAVSEIKQVARAEPVHAAEGAVALIERLSPALENVDSSSGAIGTAVNRVIAELVPVVAAAPANASTRAAWDRAREPDALRSKDTDARGPRLRREEPGVRHGGRYRGASLARPGLRIRDHEPRRVGRLLQHDEGG